MRSGTKVRRESGKGQHVGGLGVVRFRGEQWLSGGQGTVAWRKMKYLITSSGRGREQMCRPEVAGGSPALESGKVVHQTGTCRSLRPREVFDRTRLLSRRCPLNSCFHRHHVAYTPLARRLLPPIQMKINV